jgi:CRISPR type I-E-associated protein CasB/Cse2
MQSDSSNAVATANASERKDPLASLAAMLRSGATSTGERARLRRADPAQGSRNALFEAERLFHAAGIDAALPDRHRRWFLVLHCLALAEGRHDPRGAAEPGAALARMRVSEARVQQLVEADLATLFDLLPRLARRIASEAAAVNWWPLAELVLGTESDDLEREQAADRARRRIVQHFVGAAAARDAA